MTCRVCCHLMGQVIAATNRADILDPALMRSGRLDRKIEFPHPTEEARARILQVRNLNHVLLAMLPLQPLCLPSGFWGGTSLCELYVDKNQIIGRNAEGVVASSLSSCLFCPFIRHYFVITRPISCIVQVVTHGTVKLATTTSGAFRFYSPHACDYSLGRYTQGR